MDDVLKRDDNRVTVLAGVTDDANEDIKMLPIDPSTGRLLVSMTGVLTGTFVDSETPIGTINGSNVTFTLANTPDPVTSLKVYLNGVRMTLTEDYTLATATITFVTAPPTGSILRVDYRY